jgi:hypothetical protein
MWRGRFLFWLNGIKHLTVFSRISGGAFTAFCFNTEVWIKTKTKYLASVFAVGLGNTQKNGISSLSINASYISALSSVFLKMWTAEQSLSVDAS